MSAVWFCGWCGEGPYSIVLEAACRNGHCQRRMDRYAYSPNGFEVSSSTDDRRVPSTLGVNTRALPYLPESLERESSASTIEPSQQHAETPAVNEEDLLISLEPETAEPAPLESVENKDINSPFHETKDGVEPPKHGSGSPSHKRVTFCGHGKTSNPMHEKAHQTALLDSEAYSSGASSGLDDVETEEPTLGGVELLRNELVTDQDAASQENRSYALRLSNLGPPPDHQASHEVSIPVSEDSPIPVSRPRARPRCIFLCMPTFTSKQQLEYAIVSDCATDRQMYAELHKTYYTWWRTVQRWITMRRLSRVEFVRFQIYWARYVAIGPPDVGQVPPATNRDYEYIFTDIPPTILKDYLECPHHARFTGRRHLHGIPKKLSVDLSIFPRDLPHNEGWGLRLSERICWRKVSILEGVIGAAALIFAICWCRYRNASAQDGFTVAGVVLIYGTIILGLLQGVAQYNHKDS